MTEIYLIRHTQAEGNLYRVMQGHWDGGVTELGLRQIDLLAERFKDIHIDALYSSDLYRARMTATAISRWHNIPIQTEPLLREINVGPWETRFFADVAYEQPEKMQGFIADQEHWQLDGAETYPQVRDRAYPALERIAGENDGKTIAVVSHGVTIRCLLSRVTGYSLDDTEHIPLCANTAVNKLRYEDGRFTVEYINDHSHLDCLSLSPWGKTPELRAEPLDPDKDADYYTACYADAWKAAHGSLAHFSPEPYLRCAREHSRENPNAVMKLYCKDEPAGLVDLDTARGAHAGYGWISFLYLNPKYRGRGCGVQLIGRAIFLYGKLDRHALRLHVAEDNKTAVEFYQKNGFQLLSWEDNAAGRLLLMERTLEDHRHA